MSVASDCPSLAGMGFDHLSDRLDSVGIPRTHRAMRARQLRRWIHHLGETDFNAMTDIDKSTRALLSNRYTLTRPRVVDRQQSRDGTQKFLVRFDDGALAETVFIPDVGKAGAVCISCQIGCALTCSFCHTGTQKRLRNLSAPEMVAQVMIVRDALGEWPASRDKRKLSNVVFMGMGEPLYNLDAVVEAIATLSDGDGMAIGARRITVSTAGVAPRIVELGLRSNVMLAISLHAANDTLRSHLVPLNRKYPIANLLAAVRAYPNLRNGRRVTFEYVMLDGVNDSVADARDLSRLIAGIPAKINLIPFNTWPGAPYRTSPPQRIAAFRDTLLRAGYVCPVRTSRGTDIAAACGQLRTRASTSPSPGMSDNTPSSQSMSAGHGESKNMVCDVTG